MFVKSGDRAKVLYFTRIWRRTANQQTYTGPGQARIAKPWSTNVAFLFRKCKAWAKDQARIGWQFFFKMKHSTLKCGGSHVEHGTFFF